MENELLGNTSTDVPPVDDGTSETQVEAPPVDGEANQQPEGEAEDPIKTVQKLTGKLSQKMRDIGDKLTPEDIKYVLNSIISAVDIKKLNDEDKTDIISKIEDKSEDETMTENNEFMDDEPKFYENLLNDKTVKHIIDMANLQNEVSENPEGMAFDFAEAAFVFILDYNENNKFINKLNSLLRSNNFKPRPSLKSKEDLEYFGEEIYDALVKHETEHNGEVFNEIGAPQAAFYTASGDQTIGESNTIKIKAILEQARLNVKNKIK